MAQDAEQARAAVLRKVAAARRARDDAETTRDAAILQAISLDVPYALIAAAAGVSKARISQIGTEKRRP